jgi:nucleoside-diphosphate-sugar epimerase
VWEQRLPGIPPGAGSFCHAEQVALAHIAAAEHGRTGKNYILGGTDATFLEVVQTIGDITGKPVPSRPLPAFAIRLVGRLSVMAAFFTGREPDITPEGAAIVTASPRAVSQRAVRELGFRPVSIKDMLTDCWEWMRTEEGLEG